VIEFLGAGYEADRAGWDGMPSEGVAVRFPAATVNRLLHIEGRPFDLTTRHEATDDRVADLVYALGDEASSGSPRGALYVEGLTLALLGLLSAERGALRSSSGPRVARFSVSERARLREFIASNIAENLCIDRLATLVAMSPDHFSRVFKATFGQSPHAYVVEQRLEVACRALRQEPERPIAEIASGAGFSSQSHFTEVFRRRTGATPARWRSDG
jgi:AraC family transcriptional regulator